MEWKIQRGYGRPLLIAAMAILACHLPLWILRPFAALPPPLFEFDVLAALVVFAINHHVGGLALLLSWALSVLRSLAINYHFHNLAEFVDSIRFVTLLSYSPYLGARSLVFAVACLTLLVTVVFILRGLKPNARYLSGIFVALIAADIANGSATAAGLGRDRSIFTSNIVGTSLYNLMSAEMDFLKQGAQPIVRLDPPPRSYLALTDFALNGQGGAITILVESLGWPEDPEVRTWLFSQLEDPVRDAGWKAEALSEPFRGGTVAGEMRLLCGSQGHYSKLNEETSRQCVPRLLGPRGVPAMAMHGFSPRMFDRGQWWPLVGFNKMRFEDAWLSEGRHRCDGAFNALCDHDLIASALLAAESGRQFVYALTINTHLPLPATPPGEVAADLCSRRGIGDAACELLERQAALLRDMGAQLAHAGANVSLAVVVGDHSPPFHGAKDRSAFNAGKVPLWLLTRR